MKVALFGVGIAVGIAALLAWQNPKQVAAHARVAVDEAQAKIVKVKYDHCRDEYLSKTHCFQSKAHTAQDCFELIEEECGGGGSK